MNKFIKWLNEMAFVNNITDNLSRENEWEEFKDSHFTKLLVADIDSQKNSIYVYGNSLFFLVSSDMKYIGHIEINDTISHSYSKERGFYAKMFSQILTHSSIKTIKSDISLSIGAMNNYEKLSKLNNPLFKVQILTLSGIQKFNKELLLNGNNRVIISEDCFTHIWESFTKKKNSILWQKMINEQSNYIDHWLYGSDI